MKIKNRSNLKYLILCLLMCTVFLQYVTSKNRIKDKQPDPLTVLFFNSNQFKTTKHSSFTTDPSEVISGEYSLKGSYFGTDRYTSYLDTDKRYLSFEPLETYQVTFDYRILETPSSNFETIFFSPAASKQNIWLSGCTISGQKGDTGTASFTNKLADFTDYQIIWNIKDTGAISIDNIQIQNTRTGYVITALDIELTRAKINVNHSTIRTKVENRPTIPVFVPWPQPPKFLNITDGDTADTKFSLVWTGKGQARDLDSAEPDLPPIESYRIQNDHDTLYLTTLEWHYWSPDRQTLSTESKFYLDEVFIEEDTRWSKRLMINFEHPAWPGLIAKKALNLKRVGFDGIILDWWNNYAGNGRPKQNVEAARLSIIRNMRKRVGNDFILLANVNWNIKDPTGKYFSGVFLELYKPTINEPYPLTYKDEINGHPLSIERMEDLLEYWDSTLMWPKIIAMMPYKITTGDYIADRYTPENIKYAKLFAAMACVIPENGYFLYYDNSADWGEGVVDTAGYAYYDFYNTDLGKPVSGRVKVSEGVGYRKYEKGIIAYNRTNSEIDVKIRGKQLRIGALEGVFMENF